MTDSVPTPPGTEQKLTRSEFKILSNELTTYAEREATWASAMARVGATGQNYRWPDWTSTTFYTEPI